MKIDPGELRASIIEKLRTVIDPETGVDIVRMRLIEDLVVEEDGHVSCKFRPSSPLCPIAIPLSQTIQNAIAEVEGVTRQDVEVVGYLMAENLTTWLRQALEDELSEQGNDLKNES